MIILRPRGSGGTGVGDDDRRVSILITAVLPGEAVNAFLQAMRDFDVTCPGDRLRIVAAAPHHSKAEIERMFSLDPPFADWVKVII